MPRLALLAGLLAAAFLLSRQGALGADEGWVITAFGATYQVNADGSFEVTEEISVDFGSLERHGIFREIPVEYAYDARHKRVIDIRVLSVDDGQRPHKYETSRRGANLVIKIGDPGRVVSGQQRYRIRYRVQGGLNAQSGWDELYWNVTGDAWPVSIETASAIVNAPAIQDTACYEGPPGSTAPCTVLPGGSAQARFRASQVLPPGSGLTIVVAMPKGAVAVAPPRLVEIKTAAEQVWEFLGLSPLPVALAVFLAAGGALALGRYWWLAGRDRWFGDVHYLARGGRERRRPLFARDTVVPEYTPPELTGGRRLRPAEVGVLLDERADTLDVTATIVDLAVRGYLRITEVPKSWIFGKADYRLEWLRPAGSELLPYEAQLLGSLFSSGENETSMSELRYEFYDELAAVKKTLYDQVVGQDRLFAADPERVRRANLVAGGVLALAGAGAVYLLGRAAGAGIVGAPILLSGLGLLVLAPAMPRRTGLGRELFRRCLGFREYMVVAETDRQRFNEEAGIFQEYLPYAIVFGCVDRWAAAFERLGLKPEPGGWYVSSRPFTPVAFSRDLASFSSSISSAIASTPGGSGGSGFGGGSAGGGGGGGGGGSW